MLVNLTWVSHRRCQIRQTWVLGGLQVRTRGKYEQGRAAPVLQKLVCAGGEGCRGHDFGDTRMRSYVKGFKHHGMFATK